jgi:hypothetical protein
MVIGTTYFAARIDPKISLNAKRPNALKRMVPPKCLRCLK